MHAFGKNNTFDKEKERLYSNVRGNEQADKLAKEAAEKRASQRADLPVRLQKKLPAGTSACKRDYLEELKRRWVTEWQDSPRKRKLDLIDPLFPFNSFRKRLEKMSRGHTSLLVQVRCGHFPVNLYLHRIGKSDTKHCRACEEGPEGELVVETVDHFIYDCEEYTEQRRRLARDVGRTNMTTCDLMSEEKKMKALTVFITSSKRISKE